MMPRGDWFLLTPPSPLTPHPHPPSPTPSTAGSFLVLALVRGCVADYENDFGELRKGLNLTAKFADAVLFEAFWLWQQESFPTLLRGRSFLFNCSVARFVSCLACFSSFVQVGYNTGFSLVGFFPVSPLSSRWVNYNTGFSLVGFSLVGFWSVSPLSSKWVLIPAFHWLASGQFLLIRPGGI